MKRKGFTLPEILVAVLIVGMLAAMAVPMYDKAIEKSRIGEARTLLKKMMESKMRVLDNMERTTNTSGLFGIRVLDMGMSCERGGGTNSWCDTKSFRYTLLPTGTSPVSGVTLSNAVCAARCGGANKNTAFLYLGELTDGLANTSSIAKFYCNDSATGLGADGCAAYGLESTGNGPWCACD